MVLDHDPPTVARYVSKLTTVTLDTYLTAVLISRKRYLIARQPGEKIEPRRQSHEFH